MVRVVRREDELGDDLVKRFKRAVNKAGILYECKKREFFMTKNEKAKFKKKYLKK